MIATSCDYLFRLQDSDLDDLHGDDRSILRVALDVVDGQDDVLAGGDLAEDRVLRRRRIVEVVQVPVERRGEKI